MVEKINRERDQEIINDLRKQGKCNLNIIYYFISIQKRGTQKIWLFFSESLLEVIHSRPTHQTFTRLSPAFHQTFTSLSPAFHQTFKMSYTTRSDRTITDKIKILLDSINADTEKQNKIETTKKIFAILTTTPGITYVKKHSKFTKTVQNKLVEFSTTEIGELAMKWHQQIFGEPIPCNC